MAKANKNNVASVSTISTALTTYTGAFALGMDRIAKGETEMGLGAQTLAFGCFLAVEAGAIRFGEGDNEKTKRLLELGTIPAIAERLFYGIGSQSKENASLVRAALMTAIVGPSPKSDAAKYAVKDAKGEVKGTDKKVFAVDQKDYRNKQRMALKGVNLFLAMVRNKVTKGDFDANHGFKVLAMHLVPKDYDLVRNPDTIVRLDNSENLQVTFKTDKDELAFSAVRNSANAYLSANRAEKASNTGGDKTLTFFKACEYVAKHLDPARKMTEDELKVFNIMRTAILKFDNAGRINAVKKTA